MNSRCDFFFSNAFLFLYQTFLASQVDLLKSWVVVVGSFFFFFFLLLLVFILRYFSKNTDVSFTA